MDEVKKWYKDIPYENVKRMIGDNIRTMSRSFIAVGYYLKYVRDNRLYEQDCYQNIWDFAEDQYGIKKSTTSRWMAMNDRFSVNGNSPLIAEEYKGFGKSQLQEMLYIQEEDYKLITPELTKEEVRDLAKFQKENENSPNGLLNWQQTEDEALENAILEFFRERKQDLNELYTSEAFKSGDIPGMKEVICRRKKKTFKTKDNSVFMVLYEDQIYVKNCNNEQYDITWEQFFEVVHRLFDASAAGVETWENHFEPKEEQILGQDNIMNHLEYMPEGQLHKKRFPTCIFMKDTECISEECEGCSKKEEYKRLEKERTELTLEEAVEAFAENEPKRLETVLQICRDTKKPDRARAVQKCIAPYGFSGASYGEYDATYYTFTKGIGIKYGEKKLFTSYQKFVTAIMKKYGSELENTVIPAIAPAQEERCQKEASHEENAAENAADHEERCENAADHEERCESEVVYEENAAEIAAEWPRDLYDIPIPSMVMIDDILEDAERDLKDYLSCEGLPKRTVLKAQLITGGLRLIRNLVIDVMEGQDE